MKKLGLIVVLVCGCLLLYGSLEFPDWGDPASPPNSYVSPHYIEHALHETEVPNIVTAVLADYRGFDTMFETAVILAAGLACYFLLRTFDKEEEDVKLYRHISTGITLRFQSDAKTPEDDGRFEKIESNWTPYDLITKTTCRLVIPFIQIFALYVVAHGHHSPGGGFQGGVILGASIILYAISQDLRLAIRRLGEKASAILSATGVFIYAATGMICLMLGSAFLDYSRLSGIFMTDKIMARSYGILVVEIGVGLAVMAVMIWIYYNIASAGKHDEGL